MTQTSCPRAAPDVGDSSAPDRCCSSSSVGRCARQPATAAHLRRPARQSLRCC